MALFVLMCRHSLTYRGLFCAGDFGGYFGLLLGGSALSVFEIIDLIIYNAMVKMTTRKIQPGKPTIINVKSLEAEKF